MVAWVVMNRQQPRQTPPSFFPAPIPILGLTPPSSQEKLPLCFHTLAWNPFYNPFVFKFMHVMGGVPPSLLGAICRFCDRWRAASQRAGANLPHSVNRSLKIKRAATRAALLKSRGNFCALPRYFFSSAGFSAGGGAGACAGGAGVCVAPDMPSLKVRIPSPRPRASSGIFRPPNKSRIIPRTISQ